jgi:3-(3-hydroxy-phenyl)propionate hydroxylase
MPAVPVLVVGAGPVGLTAALLLARRGVEVLVVERHADLYALPRAVHLDDEVFRVLQAAGVADDVAAITRPMAGLRLLDRRLRPLVEFLRAPDDQPNGWPRGSLFHQPELEAVLRRAASAQPGLRLVTGEELTALTQDDGGVDVVLRRRADGAERSVRAGYVLGCDGANSTARRLIGSSMRDLAPPDRWLVVDARAGFSAPVWPGVHQVSDPHRAVTFMPVTDGRYRWEFRLRPGESAGDLAAPGRLRELVAPFGVTRIEVLRAVEYVFRAQLADRWRRRRVLLAGDAAHLTPPFVGQALGLGLRDVHQLAWKLTAVLAGRAGEEILDTYQAERAPHARALIRVALLLGRLMTGGGRLGAVVRPGVVQVVRRIPAVRALGASSRTPPLRRSPLVERRGRPGRRLAGSLIPQPWVLVAGRRCRLDHVLGDGPARVELLPDGRLLVAAAGRPVEVTDPDGVVAGWLRAAGARAVDVRPDRIVGAAFR